jgi:apolipoprotein D and lipocalin family protein
MQKFILTVMLAASAMLAGCAGVPKGITPVENFNAQRYLGAWYEIARLDTARKKVCATSRLITGCAMMAA